MTSKAHYNVMPQIPANGLANWDEAGSPICKDKRQAQPITDDLCRG